MFSPDGTLFSASVASHCGGGGGWTRRTANRWRRRAWGSTVWTSGHDEPHRSTKGWRPVSLPLERTCPSRCRFWTGTVFHALYARFTQHVPAAETQRYGRHILANTALALFVKETMGFHQLLDPWLSPWESRQQCLPGFGVQADLLQ